MAANLSAQAGRRAEAARARHSAEPELVEPTGTLSVGDDHEEVPAYVDVTTGHPVSAS